MRVARFAGALLLLGGLAGSALGAEDPPTGPAPRAAPEPAAGAASTAECVDAHLANQKLRKQGKLTEARAELLVCVQESCPPPVRMECARWLGELDAQMPSIVVSARDAQGKDTVDVRLTVDGRRISDSLDGRPIPLNPGPHKVTCEHHGVTRVEDVVTVESQKNRAIACDFTVKKQVEPVDRGQPIAAYILGALSLGAFASFAGFGIVGKNEAADLQTTCGEDAPAPRTNTCTDDQINPVFNKLVAADVSLGVGVALFAVGLGLFLHHYLSEPDSPAAAIRFDAGPLEGGAAGLLTISF